MSKTVYVSGWPIGADESAMRRLFEQHGRVVDVKIIRFRDTGNSRGFGFVTYANEGDAAKAIEKLHGTRQGGRVLEVAVARGPRSGADYRTPRGIVVYGFSQRVAKASRSRSRPSRATCHQAIV